MDSAQFCGGWLYLCLCIHRNNAMFFDFLNACSPLLLSPEAHLKWLLHVVSQVAVKSRIRNARAFAGDLHAFVFFLFVEFCKGLGQILSSRASLTREGPNR